MLVFLKEMLKRSDHKFIVVPIYLLEGMPILKAPSEFDGGEEVAVEIALRLVVR